MPAQPFPGFGVYPTHHCVTGSLRHMYDYEGYSISEDLLLGLGRGIGFVYFHIKGTDPFYGGRANLEGRHDEGLEKTIGRRTGVRVTSHTTASARKAQQALRDMLTRNEPALVYLDMGFLPYFEFPEEYHFGGHTVVVAGHDPATDDVLVADREPTLYPVSWDDLEKARGSTFAPFPPKHRWYTFDFTTARPPTPAEVREAISDACHQMLEPPISNLGVKGIRKAAVETRKWPATLDEEALRRTCFTGALLIDHRGGTGGGIFRYMYARFLTEAATLTNEPRLDDLAARLNTIGDRWESVATALTHAAAADDPGAQLDAAIAPLSEIADLEQEFWATLAATATA